MVDLTRAADASAAAEGPAAPDYDSWNEKADPDSADPVQAALAAKARRVQALGPLGEHLAGYGEDDDAEDGDGAGKDPATTPEPAPPWTRLVDEKTRHPYFWNRATGATVWTLAETTEPHRGDAAMWEKKEDSRGERKGATNEKARRNDSSVDDGNATATPREESDFENDDDAALEKTLSSLTTTAREVLRRETARLVANGSCDASAAVASLRSRVPAIERAIERVFAAEASESEPSAIDEDEDDAKKKRRNSEEADTLRGVEKLRAASGFPPPLPDSPPPSPPPPPGAIARPPVLRAAACAVGRAADGKGFAFAAEKQKAEKQETATGARIISKPPPPTVVERWRAARTARDEYESERSDEDDPSRQASRREAEVARWRERAARGEEFGVAGNANFAPVAGDWRRRAAAARLRREREAVMAKRETHETVRVTAVRGVVGDEIEERGNGTSAAADAAAAAAGVDVSAASLGLPGGWRAFYDADAESVYYGNADTGETRWDPPTK